MVEELPTIYTRPVRRRYHAVRRKRRDPAKVMLSWVFGGILGLVAGYAVLLNFFDRDPLSIGESLPKVSIEWKAIGRSG